MSVKKPIGKAQPIKQVKSMYAKKINLTQLRKNPTFSHRLDNLTLPELMEIYDVFMAKDKKTGKAMPTSPRTLAIAKTMQLIRTKKPQQEKNLINRINHAIVLRNQSEYSPTEAARSELHALMSDDD